MFLSAALPESTEQDVLATLLESAEMKMFLSATLLESTEQGMLATLLESAEMTVPELTVSPGMTGQERSVGFKVPLDCNSGMDAKKGDICGVISSWRGAVVTQDMATVIGGSADLGPVWKVRDKFAQSTTGLVFWSQGSPRMIGAEG